MSEKNDLIKVSDYIFEYLVSQGVRDVFMISGGGAMHMNDSVGKHPQLNYVCPHHEQVAAIAAEGYSRVSGKMGVVVVTSGPGGTNTLTGLIGQWLDSVPCLYLSGQIKQETSIIAYPELGLRQLGDQEINIVDMVKPVTKYAVMVRDPKMVRYHLERAVYLANHGRPGPVWLDVPLDIQGALVDPNLMKHYDPKEDELKFDATDLKAKVAQTIQLLKEAKRPVFLAGHGIRIAKGIEPFFTVIEKMGIPVISSFNGFDLINTDHPQFIGRIGTIGQRAGNFALQNSDLLLSVGSRNNIRQISYGWKTYARAAKKIFVDIDPAELEKPTVKPDLGIVADAKEFLLELVAQLKNEKTPDWSDWLKWGQERKKRYPVVLPEYTKPKGLVNSYFFAKTLSGLLDKKAVVITGNATASIAYFQAGEVKKGQRVIWNSGCASMGYDLPAAIGACVANGAKEVICLAGDGSLMMNLQELQTLVGYELPVKLFVLNNFGYHSIKQTQDNLFNGHAVGSNSKSGVTCPDFAKVGKAFELPVVVIKDQKDLKTKLKKVLKMKGPVLCEVWLPTNYIFSPKLSSQRLPDGRMISKPLEDMFPFLEREEFRKNMLIPELDPK